MTETLIFSTGSLVVSGALHSTSSISQLDLDGVSGSFIANAGTVELPGYAFVESSSYGMTVTGSEVVLSANGTASLLISASRDVTIPGVIRLDNGTAQLPSFRFASDSGDDGFYGENEAIAWAAGGAFRVALRAGGIGIRDNNAVTWGVTTPNGAGPLNLTGATTDPDLPTTTLILQNGSGVSTKFGVVGIYSGFGANWEQLYMRGVANSHFIFDTQAKGTGVRRPLTIGSPGTNLTIDFDSMIVSGNLQVLGSSSFDTIEATGTLTGTLVGSASYAENAGTAVLAVSAVTAITASNADTASFANPSLFTAFRPVLTVVSSSVYNVLFTDYLLLIDASSGTLPTDVVLPDTADFIKDLAGKEVTITKIDAGANDVQIMASGSQTIIGAGTSSLTDQYQGLTLIPSGGIWWVK